MGLAGIYRKVTTKHRLGDPRAKRGKKKITGGSVAILECGHARTGMHTSRNARMWCGICTREQEKKRRVKFTISQHELEEYVEREVQRRLAEKGK